MDLIVFANLYETANKLIIQSNEFIKICGKKEANDVGIITKDAQELMTELEKIFYTLIPASRAEAKKTPNFSPELFWKLIDGYPKLAEGNEAELWRLIP